MTVQYYQEVLSAGPVAFLKLLRKWKGGVFKLIYMDFIVFSVLYALLSVTYRLFLNDDHKRQFEKVVRYVYKSQSLIPVAFILGFYVNLVFGRFWKHFNTVPWISKISIMLASHLNELPQQPGAVAATGDNNESGDMARIQRRSIVRYLVSSLIITLSRVSVPVKRRFPTLDELAVKGILMEHEVEAIKQVEPVSMQPFVPITWSTAIVMRACSQGRLTNEAVVINLVKEINKFRQSLQELFLLDQVCVPLVYTQVVTLAVYSYFLSCLIGRQFIMDPSSLAGSAVSSDFYVPIFTVFQFVVYMGWLKLALTLVNPMGEDDEDFDLNCIVDYNFEVGLAIVDKVNESMPRLTKDKFFDEKIFELPLEGNMKDAKSRPFMGSVYDMKTDNDTNWFTSVRSIVSSTANVDANNNAAPKLDNISMSSISDCKSLHINIPETDSILKDTGDGPLVPTSPTTPGGISKSPIRTGMPPTKSTVPRKSSQPVSRTGPGNTSLHFASSHQIPTVREEDPTDMTEEVEMMPLVSTAEPYVASAAAPEAVEQQLSPPTYPVSIEEPHTTDHDDVALLTPSTTDIKQSTEPKADQ